MGKKFTSPLPLSAWGSNPTCRKMHEKTRVICQKQRFARSFGCVPEGGSIPSRSLKGADFSRKGACFRCTFYSRIHVFDASKTTFCLRVRVFDALSARGYAFLTPSTRHPTRFEIDFLLKGTHFRHTFVLRVRVFDDFGVPDALLATGQPTSQPVGQPTCRMGKKCARIGTFSQ